MEIIHEDFNVKVICHTVEREPVPAAFHWHENFEICQVLRNGCGFLIDGVHVDAEEGDLIAVSEYTVHRFLVREPGTRIRIIQFPVKLLLNANRPVRPLKRHISRAEIEQVPGLSGSLSALFEMMEGEGRLCNDVENPFLESLVLPLYLLLERCFPDADPERAESKARMEFFRITEYVNANYLSSLTGQAMAKALYLSRTRLAEVFFRYAGISLNQYIASLRIRRANALMDEGRSVTEAALESGFQSIRTFNSVYKRHTGITPTEYISGGKRKDEI